MPVNGLHRRQIPSRVEAQHLRTRWRRHGFAPSQKGARHHPGAPAEPGVPGNARGEEQRDLEPGLDIASTARSSSAAAMPLRRCSGSVKTLPIPPAGTALPRTAGAGEKSAHRRPGAPHPPRPRRSRPRRSDRPRGSGERSPAPASHRASAIDRADREAAPARISAAFELHRREYMAAPGRASAAAWRGWPGRSWDALRLHSRRRSAGPVSNTRTRSGWRWVSVLAKSCFR